MRIPSKRIALMPCGRRKKEGKKKNHIFNTFVKSYPWDIESKCSVSKETHLRGDKEKETSFNFKCTIIISYFC